MGFDDNRRLDLLVAAVRDSLNENAAVALDQEEVALHRVYSGAAAATTRSDAIRTLLWSWEAGVIWPPAPAADVMPGQTSIPIRGA